jgi:hypothetical protein
VTGPAATSEGTNMVFLKPLPNHWQPGDFELSVGDRPVLSPPLLHIAKTISLLESRADDYADYLRAVFHDRDPPWRAAVDRWHFEEGQHGVVLRGLCEAADAGFLFEPSMDEYKARVVYHEPTGESVRGSVAAELVSRCVVEALASTLYRVLADSTADSKCRAVFSALAQDEARHFGMFLRMLDAEAARGRRLSVPARIFHAIRRMLELEDAQIMVASCIVAGRSPAAVKLRREANAYLSKLYGRYRWKHAKYAVQMLLKVVNLRRSKAIALPCAALLLAAVKVRWLWACARNRLSPPG